MKRCAAIVLGLFLGVTFLVDGALAQGARTIVVGAAAGGGADVVGRGLSSEPAMRSAWGNPIVVDNRPGAAGLTALDYLRSARNDGSLIAVIFIAESGNTALSEPVLAALKDFVPIAYLGAMTAANGNKSWYGVYGPPGMSRATANSIEAAIQNGVRGAEFLRWTAMSKGWAQDRSASASTLEQITGHTARYGAGSVAQPPQAATPAAPTQSAGSTIPSDCAASNVTVTKDLYNSPRLDKATWPANSCGRIALKPTNGGAMYGFQNSCGCDIVLYYLKGNNTRWDQVVKAHQVTNLSQMSSAPYPKEIGSCARLPDDSYPGFNEETRMCNAYTCQLDNSCRGGGADTAR